MAMEKTSISPPMAGGFSDVCSMNGYSVETDPDGIYASDKQAVEALYSVYRGSQMELDWYKSQKQAALDDYYTTNFDPGAFVRGGSASNLTASDVGNTLAAVINTYRTFRAQIAAALNVAAVTAIAVDSGWPSNT